MPANVEQMFSVNETPWHGIGNIVPEGLKSKDAIKTAGLNWLVTKEHSYQLVNGVYRKVDGVFHLTRKDNHNVLGTVGRKYSVFQNEDAFEFADAFVESGDAKYETAGSLAGGKRVWMLMRIDGQLRVNKTDDVITKYLLITNGHDGLHSVEVALTSVRVVCQNTLELALAEAKRTKNIFRMRHSKNIKARIEEAKEALGFVNKEFDEFNEVINQLASVQANKKLVDKFFKGLGFDTEESETDKVVVEEMTELFTGGTGNTLKGVKGTLWALVNGVTEYVDHKRGTRKTVQYGSVEEARLNSAWFGAGRSLKNEALEQAVELLRA